MKIDKTNYEAFFLDYLEGNLSDHEILEMMAFLRNNPELKEELELFAPVEVMSENVLFPEKQNLKKFEFASTPVNAATFNDFCIAYHENLLQPDEIEKLNLFLHANPNKRIEFELFGKVKLQANEQVKFPAKASLKKRFIVLSSARSLVLRWTSVAAGIALIFCVYYFSQNQSVKQTGKLAQVEESPVAKSQGHLTPTSHKPIEKRSVARLDKPSIQKASIKSVENVEFDENSIQRESPGNLLLAISTPPLENSFDDPEMLPLLNSSQDQGNPFVYVYNENDDQLVEGFVHKQWVKAQQRLGLRKKVTLWDVAQITLKGYNYLSENDVKLIREYNKEGKIKLLAVQTPEYKYGITLRK